MPLEYVVEPMYENWLLLKLLERFFIFRIGTCLTQAIQAAAAAAQAAQNAAYQAKAAAQAAQAAQAATAADIARVAQIADAAQQAASQVCARKTHSRSIHSFNSSIFNISC